jgi:MerR family mercuric resistance operon transcriptional regulator
MPPSTAQEGELLTRGALAARSGCNVETIRYYEHIGILPAPPRSQGGHRLYGHDLIKR